MSQVYDVTVTITVRAETAEAAANYVRDDWIFHRVHVVSVEESTVQPPRWPPTHCPQNSL